jgi:hypothetical protein
VPEVPDKLEQALAAGLLPAELPEITLDLCLLFLGPLSADKSVDCF